MKFAMCVLTLFLASGCASKSVRPGIPTKDMVDEFSGAYRTCLVPFILDLDDGRSDATTIAHGVAGACNGEFDKLIAFMTRGDNTAVTQQVKRRAYADKVSYTLPVVLSVRNSKIPKTP